MALVRFLLCVDFLRHLQAGWTCKWFQTVRTFRSCLSSICSWMRTQLRFLKEGLSTYVTNKRCLYGISDLLLTQSSIFGIFNWLVLRKNFMLQKWLLRVENSFKVFTFECFLFPVRNCTHSIRRALCEELTGFNNAIRLLCGTALMFTICLKVRVRLQSFFNWATFWKSLLGRNEVKS